MNAKWLPALLALTLSACGGGGTSAPPAPAPVATATPQGLWNGTTSSSNKVGLAVLGNGDTWAIYTSNNAIVGALHGTTTYSGTALSGTGSEFNIASKTITAVSYTGSFSPKGSINLTTSSGTGISGSYDASFDQPASLNALSGTFVGSSVTGTTPAQAAIMGITPHGLVNTIGVGCNASGTVEPSSTGLNIFDFKLTFNGTSCALGNIASVSGIAYYDAPNRTVLMMALNSALSDGYIYVGVKP